MTWPVRLNSQAPSQCATVLAMDTPTLKGITPDPRSLSAVAVVLPAPLTCNAQLSVFSEVALVVGVRTTHGLEFGHRGEADMMSSGAAGTDCDCGVDMFPQTG
jgi:hypothetical protein